MDVGSSGNAGAISCWPGWMPATGVYCPVAEKVSMFVVPMGKPETEKDT